MTAAIEVISIRALDGKSAVKAFVDVKVGGLVLKGGKVVCQEGQRAWYATPSVKTQRGWQQTVEITSKDLRARITAIVLEAWEQHEQQALKTGETKVHRVERPADPRVEHINELADRFEPDEEIPF